MAFGARWCERYGGEVINRSRPGHAKLDVSSLLSMALSSANVLEQYTACFSRAHLLCPNALTVSVSTSVLACDGSLYRIRAVAPSIYSQTLR